MSENKIFKHDIYGKEVTVSKQGEEYLLEGNEKKVATRNAAYYADTLSDELKKGIADELGIAYTDGPRRPIGAGTSGPEPHEPQK